MDVRIPNLAESVTEGEIGTWLRKDGEAVRRGEAILELQTDKASLELAAEASGILRTLRDEGDSVRVGDVVARIDESVATADPAPAANASVAALPTAAPPPPVTPAGSAARPAPLPAPGIASEPRPPSAPPPLESRRAQPSEVAHRPADPPGTRRERMTLLRRRIAERLVDAQRQAAILTTFNEIDMSTAMALRARHQEWFTTRYGVKLGFMSIFGRAIVRVLQEIPALNASIDGDDVVYHGHVHLGVAVQAEKGLVVPVVRNAHLLGLGGLEKEIARLASLARAGKLALDDLQGATFTVSNGGVFGSLMSTPILTPPQTGILGMHAIKQRPICTNDGTIVARPMMYVALSYDHRLVDGREAVSFLVRVKELVEDPEASILEA